MSVSTRLHVAQGQTRLRQSSLTSSLLMVAVVAALAAEVPAQFQFEQLGQPFPSLQTDTRSVVLGDVDGDGDLDLLTGNSDGYYAFANLPNQNRLYLNDGAGRFADVTATHLPTSSDDTTSIALGDVDGDGDLDVVIGNTHDYYGPRQNRLYLNDGSGTFVDATVGHLPAIADYTLAIALGDLDGDGDIDIIFGGWPTRVLLNDGVGHYSDTQALSVPSGSSFMFGLDLADIDDDDDLDLVCVNGAQSTLFRNDGAGVFQDITQSHMPANTNWNSTSVALADVDGDGDIDMALGAHASIVPGGQVPPMLVGTQDRLCLNNGNGVFVDATATHLPAILDYTSSLLFGDLDDDGDLDLLAVTGIVSRQWLNDGAGTFTDATATGMQMVSCSEAALGDIDGDGDLDIVLGDTVYRGSWGQILGGQERILRNLLRQLHAPGLPTIGQNYTLDVYARHGAPHLFDVALPYVSQAPASIALEPFGTIGIDLTQAVALPPTLIMQPSGVASITIAIPNNPALVGQDLHAQALLVPYPLPPRLTNVTLGTVQ